MTVFEVPMLPPRQKRAIETRRRLLQATLDALVERGFSGTTVSEVCRRAEASRGTVLYHFPTREALLVASLDFVLTQRVEEFVAAHGSEPPRDATQLIESMWAHWKGPALYAWLELAVAARTHAELAEPLRVVMRHFDDRVREAFEVLAPTIPHGLRQSGPLFVFATLNGLAVDRIYSDEEQIQPALGLLVALVDSLMADGELPWKS